MPAAGEESLQAVLRCETPSDAATFLCAYNERMHVVSKGRSSKQSTFHRRRRELLLLRQQPSAVGRRRSPKTAALTVRADRQCCLGRVRSLDDFQEDRLEESTLSRMTKAAGFTFWFLPKFHSELSAIERWWAVLKYYVRRCHDYAESLRACILLAVKDFCGEDVIRRAFNTTFRFGTCTM